MVFSINVWLVTVGFLIMSLNIKILFPMVVMIWWYTVLILSILILSLGKVDITVDNCCIIRGISKSDTSNSLNNSVRNSHECIQKMHANKINIENQSYNYYCNNLLKIRKILIDGRYYEDLVIYYTRYDHDKEIKRLNLYYHELMGNSY